MNKKHGKWIFYEGRWIPIFAGGAPDDEPQPEPPKEPPMDLEKAKQEAINEFLKQFGFEKPDQLKEIVEKAKQADEKTTTLEQLQSELQNFKKAYETEKIQNAVLSAASKMNVLDPELVMLMAKEKAKVENGKVLIDGKPVEEFLNELKQQKPHLFKAVEGEGSGTKPQPPENKKYEELPKEERLKLALRKKFGG